MVHKPALSAALSITGKFAALYADVIAPLVFRFYPYGLQGFNHWSGETSKVQGKGRSIIYNKGEIQIAHIVVNGAAT